MRTGPAARPSSPIWNRGSRWSSWPATRPRPSAARLAEARHRGVLPPRWATPASGPAAVLLERLRAAPGRNCGDALTAAVRDAVLALVGRSQGDHRRDQGSGPVGDRPAQRAPGQRDLHVAAKVGSGQRRPDARRVGRLPPSLRRPGLGRRAGRRHPGHQGNPESIAACSFRWACNKRFRKAITTFADNSRHASPWAAKIYADARASGKDHPHAIRILARAWIRVIWPCWINGTPYNPDKHGAAVALIRHAEMKLAA